MLLRVKYWDIFGFCLVITTCYLGPTPPQESLPMDAEFPGNEANAVTSSFQRDNVHKSLRGNHGHSLLSHERRDTTFSRVVHFSLHFLVHYCVAGDSIALPLGVMLMLTSTVSRVSSFSSQRITRLIPFNLSAYGLSVRYPTLKACCYQQTSKDLLPGGWPTFRGGIPTR